MTQPDLPQILTDGTIESCEHIPWGSNYTFRVELQLGDARTLGVYKPQKGERPLWDFPDGTLYQREYAAHVASTAIGWSFVPLTVIRDGPYGVGSVQLFVEAEPVSSIRELLVLESVDLARIAAFDMIANNADRKAGHVLRDPSGKLWGIDHGLCFNVPPKVRTVLQHYCGQPVPPAVLTELRDFREDQARVSDLEQGLAEILDPQEIEVFWQRVDWLLEERVYPRLDDHRSVPWPPF